MTTHHAATCADQDCPGCGGRAIIGELSITASTGETLTASSDLGLAWKWAETEVDARAARGEMEAWKDTPYGEQCAHVAEALAGLRRAYEEASGE